MWTWLWGRYHVPQNVFLVVIIVGVNQFDDTGVIVITSIVTRVLPLCSQKIGANVTDISPPTTGTAADTTTYNGKCYVLDGTCHLFNSGEWCYIFDCKCCMYRNEKNEKNGKITFTECVNVTIDTQTFVSHKVHHILREHRGHFSSEVFLYSVVAFRSRCRQHITRK